MAAVVHATANHFCHASRPILSNSGVKVTHDFKSLFGVSPRVCALIWNMFDLNNTPGLQFRHLLWGLMLLKTYGKMATLAALAGCCKETFSKWAWITIKKIAGVKTSVIKLSNRFQQDRGRTCKLSIDCTDCPIFEPMPFSKQWFSHKWKGPGVRYEVAVCIQTGYICWVNGPFKCGIWPDIKIFRRDLKGKLAPGEMVECDAGYQGDASCRHKHIVFNQADGRAKADVRARHENVNADIKTFDCLRQVWRHDLHLHKYAFAAAAVLTQMSYTCGERTRLVFY